MQKIIVVSWAVVLLIMGTGCSSIISGTHKTVKINSNPTGAKVNIYNQEGKLVQSTNTPAKVSLERGTGYFARENYRLVFEMDGYYTGESQLEGSINGWYWGNILFGGLIGFLIVDPLTGGMYTLDPKDMTYNLVAVQPGLTPTEIKVAQEKANPDPDAKPKEETPKKDRK